MKGYCPKCNKEIDEVDYDIKNSCCFECSKKNTFPLENTDECFNLNYPTCLGIKTKCSHLIDCHNRYSTRTTRMGNETLLRMVDNDIRFWQRTLILFIFLPPIIFLILMVLTK